MRGRVPGVVVKARDDSIAMRENNPAKIARLGNSGPLSGPNVFQLVAWFA